MQREVTVLAAGGTIAMSGAVGGPASPELTGEAIVAAVPALERVRGLQVRTVAVLPSAQISGADALGIARAACAEASAGRGVVVTHGTDTLEEVVYLTDLIYAGEAPIVFTGAMRPASSPGADGPANLAEAVVVAASAEASGLGAIVSFAGEIHAARAVRKADSTALNAFHSPQLGPLGRIEENRVRIERRPARLDPIPAAHLDARVDILVTAVGVEGTLVDASVSTGAEGLVVMALGAGHVPPSVLHALARAAASVPVVATVRPNRGAILRDTYAFEGSERDLRGIAVPAGSLSSAHARIKLMACLGAGYDRADIALAFAPDDA